MTSKTKEPTCHIGRRVDKQGPRSAVHQAAVCDKYMTGDTTPNTTLNILQANICGISNKKTELAQLFYERDIHIALLQETLHHNTDPYISGYTHYPCMCRNNCRGVITYLRNDQQGGVENTPARKPAEFQQATLWHEGGKFTIFNVAQEFLSYCVKFFNIFVILVYTRRPALYLFIYFGRIYLYKKLTNSNITKK